MPFLQDDQLAHELRAAFGDYLTSFISEPKGEVRADLFRSGRYVMAYVSFPTGAAASNVMDTYIEELRTYAREQAPPEQFRMIYT